MSGDIRDAAVEDQVWSVVDILIHDCLRDSTHDVESDPMQFQHRQERIDNQFEVFLLGDPVK